jgi:hypothetical protein
MFIAVLEYTESAPLRAPCPQSTLEDVAPEGAIQYQRLHEAINISLLRREDREA